ncbi:MAG: hypothetical protein U0556_09745 [Dehalococcoidia bacterium]
MTIAPPTLTPLDEVLATRAEYQRLHVADVRARVAFDSVARRLTRALAAGLEVDELIEVARERSGYQRRQAAAARALWNRLRELLAERVAALGYDGLVIEHPGDGGYLALPVLDRPEGALLGPPDDRRQTQAAARKLALANFPRNREWQP